MNTRSNRRNISTALALAAVTSIVSVIGAGTASAASEPRGGEVTSDSANSPSFGEPLAALGGQSLAQYLSDHWAYAVAAGV